MKKSRESSIDLNLLEGRHTIIIKTFSLGRYLRSFFTAAYTIEMERLWMTDPAMQ
jgi:hypothetical protein